MAVDLDSLKTLVARLRKRAMGPRWTAGAELARSGAVMLDRESDDEIVLAVRLADWPTPPTWRELSQPITL